MKIRFSNNLNHCFSLLNYANIRNTDKSIVLASGSNLFIKFCGQPLSEVGENPSATEATLPDIVAGITFIIA